jgi:hypothetical protein
MGLVSAKRGLLEKFFGFLDGKRQKGILFLTGIVLFFHLFYNEVMYRCGYNIIR